MDNPGIGIESILSGQTDSENARTHMFPIQISPEMQQMVIPLRISEGVSQPGVYQENGTGFKIVDTVVEHISAAPFQGKHELASGMPAGLVAMTLFRRGHGRKTTDDFFDSVPQYLIGIFHIIYRFARMKYFSQE